MESSILNILHYQFDSPTPKTNLKILNPQAIGNRPCGFSLLDYQIATPD